VCELHEYVLHHWYILICTGMYRVFWIVERRHSGDFQLWQVMLGVLNEYMVVPKHTSTGPLLITIDVVQPVHTSMNHMYLVHQNLSEDTI
jgi:hypothetical protein